MNNIQMLIFAGVMIIILITLFYYWYQDAKFRKKVEDNFNQKTSDVLNSNQEMILDGEDANLIKKEKPLLVKDINRVTKHSSGKKVDLTGSIIEHDTIDDKKPALNQHNEQLIDEIPEDSVEAFFYELDQIPFDYELAGIVKELDLLINIVLESPKKIKTLPAIEQYTDKEYRYYVLDKDNEWYEYEVGKKYIIHALKLKVQLIDKNGVTNKAQLENICSELYDFAINHNGHIQYSNYEQHLSLIQAKLKTLNNIELVLELYLLTKEPVPFNKLNRLLTDLNLVNQGGKYCFINNDDVLFTIADEHGNPLSSINSYSKLSIISHLHLIKDPMLMLDYLFDFAEAFMMNIESRMLTTNQHVMNQKEYDQLNNYVKNYVNSAKKKNIILGGDLIKRIFMQ